MAIGNTSGLPHVPAYRTIEPKEYSFFDFSHIIEENYLKDGLMDLDKLKTDLSFSLNKDMPSEERRLVTDILRTVREASQLHGMTPKTVSEFRELICEKSFFKLKVLLHLREEEFYFNQFLSTVMFEGDFDFEALRTRIERFGVLPENAASFKEQLGPHFYERFERLFMAAATSGIYEGRSEESVKLLANLIAYDDTHFIYGISKSFAPSINNPDYFPICEDIKLPKDSRWLMRTAEGYRFFCGLREFLKADVSNEHKVGELLLDDVRKTGTYEINLPPAIDIKEGETVVFEGVFKTNVVGLEYDIKMDVEVPKGAEDRFFAKYDPEENKLTLTAARNYDNHEQYRIKVKMHAEITNLDGQFPAFEPNLDATREFSVFNDNEPPRLLAKAPKHVREGQLFCMDAKVIDPEGDPVNIEWYQIDGLEGKSVIHEGGVRACLQADATHQIEKPYQFRVVAKDVINSVQHPEILAKSTDDYLLVYNLPRMRVAGDEVELPLDVIEALTNPDGPQMAAIAYATSTHLLTFLRMPDELKYYGNRLKANHVANVINVTGCDGSIGKRSWSAFDDVPSSEGVYAYVATSPVRPWIKPGVYPFNGAAIYLEHMQKPIRAKIPIKGAANIKDSARTMLLSIEDPERVSDAIIRIPFRVKNVIYDKEQMLQLPDELPVTLNVKGSSRAGVVDMERKMTAVLQERDGMDAAYAIDIPLPPEYTPRTNSLSFEVEVKDRENEMAQLYAKKRFVSKGSSLFDSINLSTPTYLMPFPWVMVYIDVDKGLEQFVPVIAGAKHAFDFGGIELTAGSNWPVADKTRLKFPMAFEGYYERKRAERYLSSGGSLGGKSVFTLPVESAEKGKIEKPWIATLEWRQNISVSSYIPQYPKDRSMLKQPKIEQVEEEKKEDPFKPEKPEEKKEKPADPLAEACEASLNGLRRLIESAAIKVVESDVHAGQVFHIDLFIPSKKSVYDLDSVIYKTKNLSREFGVEMTDSEGNSYFSGAIEAVKLGNNTVRLSFEAPRLLLAGSYQPELYIKNTMMAEYTIHYHHPNDPEREYRKNFTEDVFVSGGYNLSGLTIHGLSTSKVLEGQGVSVGRRKEEER